MMPLLEDYARHVINERMAEAEQAALAAQLPRSSRGPFIAATRSRLAHGLRSLAARLDPRPAVDSRLVIIARSR